MAESRDNMALVLDSPSHRNYDGAGPDGNILKTSLKLVLFFALAVSVPAQPPAADHAADHAAGNSRQVVERHIKGMQTGNVDMAVSPYAEDAVVMTPPGAFPPGTKSLEPGIAIGKPEIRKFFASLLNADHGVAAKGMIWHLDDAPEGGVVMHWTQMKGTPQQVDGVDLYMVRDGKIISQVVSLNAPKK
jgi:ketosteroid isomerase-like protein